MFLQKMAICVYPILAIFALFLLFLANFDPPTSKMYLFHHIRCKNANGIRKKQAARLFEILGVKNAPKLKIANFDPKMAFEGQNWPRCTKWGLTNSFRTVKGIFEPMTYKIVLFTNNYPFLSYLSKKIECQIQLGRRGIGEKL